MGKEIRGWKKAAIYDPATGDVVQFNKITPELSDLVLGHIKTDDTLGQIFGGRDYLLQIGTTDMDSTKKAQLEAWMEADTPVRAVVWNPTGKNVQWYEDSELKFMVGSGVSARDGADIHQVELTRVGGADVAIFNNRNLLHQQNINGVVVTGWDDGDADEVADGWTETDVETVDFDGGAQTLTNTGGEGSMVIDAIAQLVFPIEGIDQAVLSADYTYRSGTVALKLIQKNYAGVAQATDTDTVDDDDRFTVPSTTVANIYRFAVELVNDDEAFDIDVEDPALRLDGVSTYVAG